MPAASCILALKAAAGLGMACRSAVMKDLGLEGPWRQSGVVREFGILNPRVICSDLDIAPDESVEYGSRKCLDICRAVSSLINDGESFSKILHFFKLEMRMNAVFKMRQLSLG